MCFHRLFVVRREYGRSDRQMDSGQEEYDPAEPTDEVSNMVSHGHFAMRDR